MEITLDRTNGGKGRINSIRVYDNGKLMASIHISKEQSIDVFKLEEGVTLKDANLEGYTTHVKD